MFAYHETTIINITNNTSIPAGGSYTSDVIDLSFTSVGQFSLQIALTGDGTGKVDYLVSNNGKDYLIPSEASSIYTSFTKTSGYNSDGKDMKSFFPPLAKYMKIKVTETGNTNPITISLWLAMR